MSGNHLDRVDACVLILLALVAAGVPFAFAGYEIKLATTIAVQAGLAVALGFVVGPGGMVSIGHAAFAGVAAYVFAMIAPASEPANLLSTAAISIVGAAVVAAAIGAVSIRSRGMYFILMTLAFGQLGYHLFHDMGLVGSADGAYINMRPELRLFGTAVSLDEPERYYVVVAIVVAAVIGATWWLKRSAFGSVLVASRDNEVRVRAFGFSPYVVRLIAFTISGSMAGAMGYLTAAQHGFVAPEMLAWHASAIPLVMVLIGGKDTVSGPAVGAIVLLLAEEVLQRMTEHWLIGVGLIIVAVVLFAPKGLVPYAARLSIPALGLRHA